MRSFDSVDIEVCADNIMATEKVELQGVILARLREILSSTAVYSTRVYSASSTLCFMFVFQARNPDEVRDSVQLLDISDNSELQVTFQSSSLNCRITAVPWVGEDTGPLGLSWQFSAGDVLLWGGVMGGILTACSIAVCCFVQLTANKERARAADLLAKDSELYAKFLHEHPPPGSKKKEPVKKKKKHKEEEEESEEV